jgi:hypothetical protein
MSPYAKHALAHLPESYMGMIVAHGLVSDRALECRYSDAMVAGLRYQLRHPDEVYREPSVEGQPITSHA